jgi:rod shape-determining protein MreC
MAGIGFLKRFPGLSVLITLEFLLLLLVSYQVQVDERISLLEKTALAVFGPIQKLNHRLWGSLSRTVEEKRTIDELRSENQRLREEVRLLRKTELLYVETEIENDRLRDKLNLPKEESWAYVHAEVIGRSHRRNDYMITINKGSADGVRRDYGVIGPTGVVGVVWEVSPNYAKVLTTNNPSSVVAALVQDSRFNESYVRGIGQWQGTEGVSRGQLNNYPSFEPVKLGDVVLTSGLDGVYPKGLQIGRVDEIGETVELSRDVKIRLSTDFGRLENVTVLVPLCAEELNELD